MDTWKFYDITHREHVVCNPTSEEKLTRLVELLRLPTDAQVVDIACGKGEFLIRLAEAYGARGVGIDISPFFVADAERRLETRASGVGITFTQMNGADFRPDEPHNFDLASCIGASWVFGGHADTLEALIRMVKPGGWVIVGEPYWRAGAVRGLPGGIWGRERGLREPLLQCRSRRAARIGSRPRHCEQQRRLGQVRRPPMVRDGRVRSHPSR